MDSQNNQNKGQNSPEKEKANNNTVMAVLSYIGPLVIISYLVSRSNQFVKFHIKQGLVLFGIEIILWILGSVMFSLWFLINIVNLFTLVLSIIGIVNALQGKEKELPITGKFAKMFSI